MTTNDRNIQLDDIPLPAGALEAAEWRRSPNDRAHNRRFRSKSFPVIREWLRVQTGGVELVEDSGKHTITRTVAIEQTTTGAGVLLIADQALKLAKVLAEAARYVADLESADAPMSAHAGDPDALTAEQRSELERLADEHGDRLTEQIVVDAARSPDSPLHSFFEWDDAKAAAKHREGWANEEHGWIGIRPPRPWPP